MENNLPFAEMPPEEGLWDTGGILSPFQPTLNEDLVKVLAFAQVGVDDVFVDLGCGDGRVLLTAAFLQCKKVIGYELNKEVLQIARNSVEELGLGDCVKLFCGDFLNADLAEATVIYLYLLPEAIEKLRGVIDKGFGMRTRVLISLHFPVLWMDGERFGDYYVYVNKLV